MSDIDLDAIRARADAATPGKWELFDSYGDIWVGGGISDIYEDKLEWIARVETYARSDADAEFIAGARQWVPQLCDEVDRLRARVSELEAERDKRAQVLLERVIGTFKSEMD